MNERTSWDAALRAEVVAAAHRQHRGAPVPAPSSRTRRGWAWVRPVVVATAVLGIVTTAAFLALAGSPARAEIQVEVVGEHLVVSLGELQHDPYQVEQEMRAAGFDAEVTPVPVGPSGVGKFVGSQSSGTLPRELVPLDPTVNSFAAFALPAGWDGTVDLMVGRPALAGERYLAFTDALAPGEPLACLPLVGLKATDAVDAVRGAPADVTFRLHGDPDERTFQSSEIAGLLPDLEVQHADAVAPGKVVVWLAAPGHPGARSSPPPGCN